MGNILKNKYKFTLYLIIVAGILVRTILYLQNPSFWGDEAGLGLNIINKSCWGLFGRLDNLQACPIGFLIASKLMLKIFSPDSLFYRDLILRFLPFISGVLSIFAFLQLTKLLFKNDKGKILISTLLVSLTPLPVIYSSQYKQYSTEMLVTIILLTVFYKLINEERKDLLLLSFIIAISIWFSYSSVFIIAAGFLALFIKNKKEAIKAAILPFTGAVALLILNLGTIFDSTYKNMYDSWSAIPAFLSLEHPLRIFLRVGELFVPDVLVYNGKPVLALAGALIIYFFIRYFFSEQNIYNKILFCLPMLLVLAASFMHKYPVCARLMLFLFPTVIIYIMSLKTKYDNIAKFILFIVIIISLLSYDYHLHYSYARDIVPLLEDKIQNFNNVIYDYPNYEYRFYAKNPSITNSNPQIEIACLEESLDICKGYVNELSPGDYYFISHQYYAKQIFDNDNKFRIINDLDIGYIPKIIKVIHFEVK